MSARVGTWLVRQAKWLIDNVSPWIRIVGSGLTIAALFATITWLLTDKPLAIDRLATTSPTGR